MKQNKKKSENVFFSGKPISVTSAGQAHRVTKAIQLPASFLSNQPLHSPALVKYIQQKGLFIMFKFKHLFQVERLLLPQQLPQR